MARFSRVRISVQNRLLRVFKKEYLQALKSARIECQEIFKEQDIFVGSEP